MFSPDRSTFLATAIHCHPLPHVPRSGGVDEGETARDLCPLCPLCPCRPWAFGKVSKRLGQLERHMPRPLPHCGVGVELFGLGMAWQRCHSFFFPCSEAVASVNQIWGERQRLAENGLSVLASCPEIWTWKDYENHERCVFFFWRIEANNLFLRCPREVDQGFETWFDQISCTVQARCSSQERSGSMPRDKAWFSAIGISVFQSDLFEVRTR